MIKGKKYLKKQVVASCACIEHGCSIADRL